MKAAPCLWGVLATVAVLAVGSTNLDRGTAPVTPVSRDSGIAHELPGESLYQLHSLWTTDEGERLRLQDLAGFTEVVAFIYTRCASLCPTMVRDLKAMDARLHGHAHSGTRFVLVTMDPEHDTPEVLSEFRSRMKLDPSRWVLLRGTSADTRELSAVLGFNYGRGDGRDYTHSSLVTVLDPHGAIVHQQTAVGADPARALVAIEAAAGQ